MLATAIELMQRGTTPSVSDVAEAAAVSRATAYRYFPSQAALVQAVVDEALGPILEWSTEATDAETRLDSLLTSSLPRIDQFEATFRAALALSLQQWGREQAGTLGDEVPFRRGHRVALLEKALAPLRKQLPKDRLRELVHGLSLVFGIEALIVLKDICDLDAAQARDVLLRTASALLNEAIRPRDGGANGKRR
jgi:AcrR family transcriptional regulator